MPRAARRGTPTDADAVRRRGQRLLYATVLWNAIEGATALASGLVAGSVALTAFGLDSSIEVFVSLVAVWHLERATSARTRLGLRLVGASFVLVALYIAGEAASRLVGGERARLAVAGLVVTAAAVPVMGGLGLLKRRVAEVTNNSVLRAEAKFSFVDAALSATVLLGLGLDQGLGLWWADPAMALVVAAIAAREGAQSLRGSAMPTGLVVLMALAGPPSLAWAQASPGWALATPEATSQSPRTLLQALQVEEAGAEGREAPRRVDPDRPHFPEASTTVGRGRVVLESGYTFAEKRSSTFVSHAFPEALLRIGVFADWFELRIGQSFVIERETVAGGARRASGAQDLYLGAKLALTTQHGFVPQIAVIPQITVPTGSREVTAGRALPGLNVDCGWEVINERLGIELLVATNQIREDAHHAPVEIATGLTAAVNVLKNLETFAEWDAFYPQGGTSGATPRHYAFGGLVYFVTNDLALDLRVGVGLNGRANDIVAGAGFALRY